MASFGVIGLVGAYMYSNDECVTKMGLNPYSENTVQYWMEHAAYFPQRTVSMTAQCNGHSIVLVLVCTSLNEGLVLNPFYSLPCPPSL